MKVIGPDKTFIDYFQSAYILQRGLKTHFGIRINPGLCWPVAKIDEGSATICGREIPLPVALENLPSHVRIIVEDHLLNYPESDLMSVLSGEKTFEGALASGERLEVKCVAAYQRIRLPDAS